MHPNTAIPKAVQGAYLTSLYKTSFDLIYQGVLEEVISGENKGVLEQFSDRLDTLEDGDKYRKLLDDANAVEFNYILSFAIIDLIFADIPAITV